MAQWHGTMVGGGWGQGGRGRSDPNTPEPNSPLTSTPLTPTLPTQPPDPNLSPLCGESSTSALLQTFVRRLHSNSRLRSNVSPVVWQIFCGESSMRRILWQPVWLELGVAK